jgi:hypothetical protein
VLGFFKRWFSKPVRNDSPILLVIAEDQMTQEALRRDFESLNCIVIPALSGQSALKSLEMGPLPDVIILDFVISDEDGPTLFRRFAMDKRYSSIPVVPLPFSLSDELVTGGIKVIGELPTSPVEITSLPYPLLFSVASALRKTNAGLPIAFREKLRRLTRSITDGIKTSR